MRTDRKYHAFISYSHKDKSYATSIQKSIETLGLPFYRNWQPDVNIFRDERKIPLSGSLTEKIINGLQESDYLIVIASSNSANSTWVKEEILNWHKLNQDDFGFINNFNFILIDNVIEWDNLNQDFDSLKTTALPKFEKRIFKELPLWANLQQYCKDGKFQTSNANYEWEIAKIKGLLLNKKPDEIIDEVSNARRLFRILSGIVISILVGLSIFSFNSRQIAISERIKADKSAKEEIAQKILANKARDDAKMQEKIAVLHKDTAIYERRRAEEQETIAINYANTIRLKNIASEIANRGLKIKDKNPTLALRLLERSYNIVKEPGVLKSMNNLFSTAAFYSKKITISRQVSDFKLVDNSGEIIIACGNEILLLDSLGDVLKVYKEHRKRVVGLAIAPDNSFFVSIGEDSLMIKWKFDNTSPAFVIREESSITALNISTTNDIAIGVRRKAFVYSSVGIKLKVLVAKQGTIKSLSFSPNGNRIITGSSNVSNDNERNRYFEAKVWDISNSGDSANVILNLPHGDIVLSVDYDPLGQILLTGGGDGKVKLWDANTGLLLKVLLASENTFTGRDDMYVKQVIFSRNGQNILSSGNDNSIFLWNRDGVLLRNFVLYEGSINEILIAFNKQSNQIISSAQNQKQLMYWDNYDQQISSYTDTDAFRTSLSQNGNYAISGGSKIKLYSVSEKKIIRTHSHNNILNIGFLGDDHYFLKIFNSINIYSTSDDRFKRVIPDVKLIKPIPYTSKAVMLDINGQVLFFDAYKNNITLELRNQKFENISSIAFNNNLNILIVGSEAGNLSWYSLKGVLINRINNAHKNSIINLSIANNGSVLSSGFDDMVIYWSTDGKPISSIKVQNLLSAELSPSSDIYVAISHNRIYYFNIDGSEITSYQGILGGSFSFGFSADGQYFILGRAGAANKKVIIKRNMIGLQNFLDSKHLFSFSDKELGVFNVNTNYAVSK